MPFGKSQAALAVPRWLASSLECTREWLINPDTGSAVDDCQCVSKYPSLARTLGDERYEQTKTVL